MAISGNAGTKPTRVGVILYYNGGAGKYELAPQPLQPQQAITVDVGKIITSQVPDANGHTIPPGTTTGSYELNDLDDRAVGYLYEGKLQVDRRNGFVTYGCALCCAYDWPYIPGFTTHVGASPGPVAYFAYSTCTDQQTDFTSIATAWASSNNSIATLSGPWVSAVAPGSTFSNANANIRNLVGFYKCPFITTPATGDINILAPKFDIEYSSYIPVDHVFSPSICFYGGAGYFLMYRGDANRGTYRTREFMTLVPDTQQAYGFDPSTTETKNYGYGSPANGVTLSNADEDGSGGDCYLYNDSGNASPSGFQRNTAFPASHQGQLQFYGSAADPLEYQWFDIQWNETTTINTNNPSIMTSSVTYDFTCYPSHQVKVNGNPIFTYTPGDNSTSYITLCLSHALPHVTGSVGPIQVQPYY